MIHNAAQIKQASDIVEVIAEHIKLKKDGAGYAACCPFHSERTPSFKVSKSDQFYKCFGCGKSGDVIKFLMEFRNIGYVDAVQYLADKYRIEMDRDDGKYVAPIPRLEKVSKEIIDYFESRGISNNTLLRMGITEHEGQICFNYYRDGELVNIKYRGRGKKFSLNKGSQLIFYNLDAIKDEDEAVIVEGEIDCLSLYEAGIYNVVSVPNGATTGNTSLRYLDNCWQYFVNKKKVVIFTDNDEPGNQLAAELSRRIGREICFKVTPPPECKDANDVLQKHGKTGLKEIVELANRWPIDGVLGMDDLYDQVEDYYLHGYPKGCAAGIGEFDELLTFTGGQLTVVTGAPSSGKSEFIDHLMVCLARRHNWRFAICSFESRPDYHTTKIMEKYTGLSFDFRKDPSHRLNRDQFDESVYFIDQYIRFINPAEVDLTIDGILGKCKELVASIGIKAVIIDPWNHIEHNIPANMTETQYISLALTKIRDFCAKTDTHVFLVAHPRKMMKDPKSKQYPPATLYDIAGSAHFFNKTDNGISVYRDFEQNIVTVYVQKVRFSWMGKVGFTSFTYDTYTRQYHSI